MSTKNNEDYKKTTLSALDDFKREIEEREMKLWATNINIRARIRNSKKETLYIAFKKK